MADVVILDHILHNILLRLPAKALLRFRCVSRHWNRLITEPYFMKSRSRRMIILSTSRLHLIDGNLPIDDRDHSIVNLRSPFGQEKGTEMTVVGTFNGIVLLILTNLYQIPNTQRLRSPKQTRSRMILYNPLTRASKEVVQLPRYRFNDDCTYAFGFGYGKTPDDLKIVRLEGRESFDDEWGNCHVFNLKESSWSMQRYLIPTYNFDNGMAGIFLNGFLYWVACRIDSVSVIFGLNVKEMVYSEISLPHQRNCTSYLLGSLKGCLCLITVSNFNNFDVYVKGVDYSWCQLCSFTLRLEGNRPNIFYPVNILDDGRILMVDASSQVFIYDPSKHSTKLLIVVSVENFEVVRGIEYVESLASPSDMCSV